nr:hypothetical protein [Pseudomonadota bacterium]
LEAVAASEPQKSSIAADNVNSKYQGIVQESAAKPTLSGRNDTKAIFDDIDAMLNENIENASTEDLEDSALNDSDKSSVENLAKSTEYHSYEFIEEDMDNPLVDSNEGFEDLNLKKAAPEKPVAAQPWQRATVTAAAQTAKPLAQAAAQPVKITNIAEQKDEKKAMSSIMGHLTNYLDKNRIARSVMMRETHNKQLDKILNGIISQEIKDPKVALTQILESAALPKQGNRNFKHDDASQYIKAITKIVGDTNIQSYVAATLNSPCNPTIMEFGNSAGDKTIKTLLETSATNKCPKLLSTVEKAATEQPAPVKEQEQAVTTSARR